uniref:Uncharacterized protein n=2 Tax=Caenorhabditis japonica TaxID=281687 RepID=A0A8R1E3S0_CAEJA
MQAAAALYNESAFLPNASSRQPVAFINDRLHDQTLETIIEQICATGGFGVSQNLLDMGAELRNFTSRFTEMTAQMAVAPGRNNLQAQLYGRPARPRPVQNSRPAPQARAALELQRIAQIGERRYQEQQQAQAQVQQQQQRQNPKTEEQKNPSREPLEEGQISETPSFQESTNERASRRKIQQPQSLNSMVTHAMVDPIVGYISERSLENVNNVGFYGENWLSRTVRNRTARNGTVTNGTARNGTSW